MGCVGPFKNTHMHNRRSSLLVWPRCVQTSIEGVFAKLRGVENLPAFPISHCSHSNGCLVGICALVTQLLATELAMLWYTHCQERYNLQV